MKQQGLHPVPQNALTLYELSCSWPNERRARFVDAANVGYPYKRASMRLLTREAESDYVE